MTNCFVMKWMILFTVFILIFSACASTSGKGAGLSLMEAIEQAAEKTAGELPQGVKVAVVAFESESGGLSENIMEELNGALKDRRIDVVDRQNLMHILREQNFQISGHVDDNTAVSIGKIAGAHIVITGQLSIFGDVYRFRTTALSVETAARVSMTRLDVRNDEALRRMIGGTR